MAGSGDEIAAAEGQGRGHLRASHADREQVIGTLKAAFVQGMLAKDEFDLRVGQAFAARTHAELAALTDDLPVKPIAAQPPRPVRAQGEQPVLRPGPVLAVATALYAGVWAFTFLPPWPTDSDGDPPAPVILLFFSTTLIYLFVLVIAVGHMIASRHEKRSGGRPAPGAGGQASRRPPSAGPGGQLPPAGHGQQHTAEAARSDPAHPRPPGSRSAHQRRHRGHRCTMGYAGN
jgi:Domain of unknown function (DUF1707)